MINFRRDWLANKENNVWYTNNKSWEPTLERIIKVTEKDIASYRDDGRVIICDNFWLFKLLVGVYALGDGSEQIINKMRQLLKSLPEMDSYFITASTKVKLERAKIREQETGISPSDSLLINHPEIYEKREQIFKDLIFWRFPNTTIIDTSDKTPKQLANEIANDGIFTRDMQ
ncbi:MAG: hypothetical protein FWE16_03630 [Firmicutes bacterium]|nr:hypothetical protein [Bacillota bacterium]